MLRAWGVTALLLAACGPGGGGGPGPDGGPLPTADCTAAGEDPNAFYAAPPAPGPEERGAVLRCESLRAEEQQPGFSGYRVLYATSAQVHEDGGVREEGRVGSGMVFIPEAEASGARAVIANTHGTTGVLPACAPSRGRGFDRSTVMEKLQTVAPGAVVVVPDYLGLGVDEGHRPPDANTSFTDPLNPFATVRPLQTVSHPYASLETEGRATLDLAAAARLLPDAGLGSAPKLLAVGQSQGGHAALSTAEVAARGYAAGEVTLAGVIAGAPGSELDTGEFMERDIERVLLPMTLAGLSIEHRELRASHYLSRQALAAFRHTAGAQCLTHSTVLSWVVTFSSYLASAPLTRVDMAADPLAVSTLRANTPGYQPASVPIFVGQVTGDPFVDPRRTARLVERLRQTNPGLITSCVFPGEDLDAAWTERTGNHEAFGRMFSATAATLGTCEGAEGPVTTDALRFAASVLN